MRVTIAAIGRLKEGPERELFQRYVSNANALGRRIKLGPLDLIEFAESRRASADERRDEEARRLLDAIGDAHLVALDERGRQHDSAAFAGTLRRLRDDGTARVVFAIGGADGHGSALLRIAREKLGLGAMTLPHGLVRVVLAEQLYRAATIIAGHPYHRA